MEDSLVIRKQDRQSSKGGIKTMPFIIANEAFAVVAGLGLQSNMIIYLKSDYHMDGANGASFLFLWAAASNFLTVPGAFISDSYLGRFWAIGLGSIASFIGGVLLWSTALIPGAKPAACIDISSQQSSCKSPNPAQMALLHSSFLMTAFGAAGTRPSQAFGADQFDNRDNPSNVNVLQSFFNWYYVTFGVALVIAVTVIVYIQQEYGWRVGFGVPVGIVALATIFFFWGSPWYVKVKPERSLFTGMTQVMVAAFKNRHLGFPHNSAAEVGYYYKSDHSSRLVAPTERLRFLNKACIIRDREKDLKNDGTASNPWTLCTVDQVEGLKSLIRVIPMWSTSIIMNFIMYQQPFAVLQAQTMDRHLGPKFQIPAGSIGVFGIVSMTVWVAIYDRIIIRHVGRFTNRQRLGMGLLISTGSVAVAAIVERHRRNTAIHYESALNMSALWLAPQILMGGLAEGFNFIGQSEFYYNELPKTMSSIGMSLFSLGTAFGNLLGGVIVKAVNKISSDGGRKASWMANDLNKGHLDYYYWLLAVLGCINLVYFLLCSWSYGPAKDETVALEKNYRGKEEEEDPQMFK